MKSFVYSVNGTGLNRNHHVTDFDMEYGVFESYKDALNMFEKLVNEATDYNEEFFSKFPPYVFCWQVQLEKWEITNDDVIYDVLDEVNLYRNRE